MKKFKCEICNRNLHINTYKARKMHINGTKHKILKETYFMELMEKQNVKEEIQSHKKIMNEDFDLLLGKQNFGFRLPPCNFSKEFVFPDCPKNFRLPKFFDFSDPKNFSSDINEALQDILNKY